MDTPPLPTPPPGYGTPPPTPHLSNQEVATALSAGPTAVARVDRMAKLIERATLIALALAVLIDITLSVLVFGAVDKIDNVVTIIHSNQVTNSAVAFNTNAEVTSLVEVNECQTQGFDSVLTELAASQHDPTFVFQFPKPCTIPKIPKLTVPKPSQS